MACECVSAGSRLAFDRSFAWGMRRSSSARRLPGNLLSVAACNDNRRRTQAFISANNLPSLHPSGHTRRSCFERLNGWPSRSLDLPDRSNLNRNSKVLDFVQFGGPTKTRFSSDRWAAEIRGSVERAARLGPSHCFVARSCGRFGSNLPVGTWLELHRRSLTSGVKAIAPLVSHGAELVIGVSSLTAEQRVTAQRGHRPSHVVARLLVVPVPSVQ